VTPQEARLAFLRRLHHVAQRLPNGLLQRLVEDAEFFADWNQGKKRARGASRRKQTERLVEAAETKRLKSLDMFKAP
jgi:hypothetical protein